MKRPKRPDHPLTCRCRECRYFWNEYAEVNDFPEEPEDDQEEFLLRYTDFEGNQLWQKESIVGMEKARTEAKRLFGLSLLNIVYVTAYRIEPVASFTTENTVVERKL